MEKEIEPYSRLPEEWVTKARPKREKKKKKEKIKGCEFNCKAVN